MKKTLYFLSIALLSLTGCKNDDTTVYPINPEQPQNLLVGKWNMIKGEMYTNGELTLEEDLKTADCDYDFYNFKNDGKKDETYHDEDNCSPENFAGKWSYTEAAKRLTITDDDDGYEMLFEVVSVSKTDLKIKLLVEDGTAVPAGIDVFTYLKK